MQIVTQPIDPENFGQGRGVAAVGLLFRSLFRLDQHGLLAVVLVEHFQQPVVEAADFQNRHKAALGDRITAQLLQERLDPPPLGADLST